MMFKPTYITVASNADVRCGELLQHLADIQYLNENGGVVVTGKHQAMPIENKSDMLLPTDAQERKQIPIVSGVLDYFPLAIAEVAKCSKAGNDQHHPGEPLFWDKTKSTDHADCIGRHLIDRGKFDTDGQRHSAKLAWRALALLQLELEEETKKGN
jgi:hypothetical protein